MSYSFGMFFKQVSGADEAMQIMEDVAKELYENGVSYIQSEHNFIPSVDYNKYMPEADKFWLYNLFTLKFVYWKEEKLLGLSGYEYPFDTKKYFDVHVCFQNGTDQNYSYKTWGNNIIAFTEEKEKVKQMSIKEIYDFIGLPEERNASNAAYYRRWSLYKKIVERLRLEAYIEGGGEDEAFRVYRLCAIKNAYQHTHLNACVRRYTYQYKEQKM